MEGQWEWLRQLQLHDACVLEARRDAGGVQYGLMCGGRVDRGLAAPRRAGNPCPGLSSGSSYCIMRNPAFGCFAPPGPTGAG